MEELACTECMWCGTRDETQYDHTKELWTCPDCGAEVEWIDPLFPRDFNWNKK